jgi:hypothetical protein
MSDRVINGYEGIKLFSATKAMDRERLGESVTDWLDRRPEIEVVDTVVRQSSDNQFHCVTILVFYNRR